MRPLWRIGGAAAITAGLIALQLALAPSTGSTGLLADAAHNAVDLASLILAFVAARVARRPPSERRSFGHGRANALAAFVSAGVLVAVTAAVAVVAMVRLISPGVVHPTGVLVAAGVGLVGNLVAAQILHQHEGHDLNRRAARLHLLGDAGASAAVLAAGIAIAVIGPSASRLDPIASLLICALLVREGMGLVGESGELLLEASPAGLEPAEVRGGLATQSGIEDVHDLHLWGLGEGRLAMSAHLVVDEGTSLASCGTMADQLRRGLEQRFGAVHATFEFEAGGCDDHPERHR